MAKEILEEKNLNHLLQAVGHLAQLQQKQMWLDYDQEADVLYIHFEDGASSTHGEMQDNGVILEYNGSTLVGVTILEASQRGATTQAA